MLDLSNWELLGLAVDVFIVYLLNHFYKNQVKDADLIMHAKSYDVGDELKTALDLAADKCLPYACVVGLTQPIGAPLKSYYTDSLGVIQHQLFVEHKSKRTQGFWADVKNIIKDELNVRPFVLVSPEQHMSSSGQSSGQCSVVEVTDALSAECLRESLTVTHDHYKPTSGSILTRGLDRLFGEVTRGYQETERMLNVGVPLLGIGKLMLVGGGRVVLSSPDNGGGRRYFLTTSSRQELVHSLKSIAHRLNIARWLVGIVGLAAVGYILSRAVCTYKSQLESRRLLAELQQKRQQSATMQGIDPNTSPTVAMEPASSSPPCVVCLTEAREVVLLDCGHICLCGDCATALPMPKLCPICRQRVHKIIPTYVS